MIAVVRKFSVLYKGAICKVLYVVQGETGTAFAVARGDELLTIKLEEISKVMPDD